MIIIMIILIVWTGQQCVHGSEKRLDVYIESSICNKSNFRSNGKDNVLDIHSRRMFDRGYIIQKPFDRFDITTHVVEYSWT